MKFARLDFQRSACLRRHRPFINHRSRWLAWVRVFTVIAMGTWLNTANGEAAAPQALAQYVQTPDAAYAWSVRQDLQRGGCRVVELALTSQEWRGHSWQHRLFLILPIHRGAAQDAVMFIDGGDWQERDEKPVDRPGLPRGVSRFVPLALATQSPIVVLRNVPQQPMFDGKREDALIAMTFDQYLRTEQSDWPLLLPMVNAAVRAMDATQAFLQQEKLPEVTGFTLTGASKRGWTAWLTAAVDPRVRGVVPMVIDLLNMNAQFKQQIADYGSFSPQLRDYTQLNLFDRLQTPDGQALVRLVDPYAYRDRLTQPKLMVLGTNDPYWTVDALSLYWPGLRGDAYITYIPNAGHTLGGDWRRVAGSLFALHRHAHHLEAMPQLAWQFGPADAQGIVELSVTSDTAPSEVRLWTATSTTRDFRNATWTATPVPAKADNDQAWAVTLAPDPQAYRAAMVECVYPRRPFALHLTTVIQVLPPAQ